MKMIVWLLEPLTDQNINDVHKELAELRCGNGAKWGIAELVERVLAAAELVFAVDCLEKGDDNLQEMLLSLGAKGDHGDHGVNRQR